MANPVSGVPHVDLIESSVADVAPVGVTRLSRIGGVTMQSVDGGAPTAIGSGGGSSVSLDYENTLFNFAKSQYSGLGQKVFYPFLKPNAGVSGSDFVTDSVVGAASATSIVSTSPGGIVQLTTDAAVNSSVGLHFPGSSSTVFGPPVVASLKNGAPFFFCARVKFVPGATLTGGLAVVGLTSFSAPNTAYGIYIGVRASSSTTNFSITAFSPGATTAALPQLIDATQFFDIAYGSDGANLQPYFGQAMLGTLAAAGSPVTDFTNVNAGAATPSAFVLNSSAATGAWTMLVDSIFVATAMPTT